MVNGFATNHERFGELSALALVGQLSPSEYQELRRHLESCIACREEHRDFADVLGRQLPLLHQHPVLDSETGESDDIAGEKSKVFSVERDPVAESALGWRRPPAIKVQKHWLVPKRVPQLVAAGCLALLVTVLLFGFGILRYELRERSLMAALAALKAEVGVLRGRAASNPSVNSSAGGQGVNIPATRVNQRSELALRALEARLNASKSELRLLKDELEKTRRQETETSVSAQFSRDALKKKTQEVEALNQERDQTLAAVQAKVQEIQALSLELSEAHESLARDRDLLAHDRDIRDLMGARNLRMIDIADVDSKGRTRKPIGRLFYTEGKSLVFYAYDLDRGAPSMKNAAFQVWGSKNPDQSSVRSLGIFYRDLQNANSWVLSFDNPRVLAEIDSVFVTIEPPGGSKKPTGAHLLETTLKTEMNHP